jgi:hypothetical protein
MNRLDVEKIREELERLMREQVESLARQTYLGVSAEELKLASERLRRIRELSADYLEAMKRDPE